MDSFDKAIENLKIRKARLENGLINCIPNPFPRLRNWLPGIEKRRYNVITAQAKVGKSKLVDYMYVYSPFFYMLEHREQLKLNILYFTLEMGKQEKYYEFLCHLLYRLDNIRCSPTELKSTSVPVDSKIIELIESPKYQQYIAEYKKSVIYIDDIKNPTGIWKHIRDFMLQRGHYVYKDVKFKDANGFEISKSIIDYYQPDDEEEYTLVILDNYANLSTESGMNLKESITKMSKYAIDLRDMFNINFTAVQHQALAGEGIENQKLNKLYPSAADLGDSKNTARDINLLIGLFSPYKYSITTYEGYDITRFKNNIRFLLIIEDRDNGGGGQICPLLFDGAVSNFCELPLPNNKTEIEKVLKYVENVITKKSKPVFTLIAKKSLKGKSNTIKGLYRSWNNLIFTGLSINKN